METSDKHSMCNRNSTSVDMDVLRSTTDTDKFKLKYDNLTDANDDKCVNNQKICNNNLKNAKTMHTNDCSVVIDDDIQTNQPPQPNQSSVEQSLESLPQPPSSPQHQPYGCKHYKRKAKFVVSSDKISQTNTHTHIDSIQFLLAVRWVSLRIVWMHDNTQRKKKMVAIHANRQVYCENDFNLTNLS